MFDRLFNRLSSWITTLVGETPAHRSAQEESLTQFEAHAEKFERCTRSMSRTLAQCGVSHDEDGDGTMNSHGGRSNADS